MFHYLLKPSLREAFSSRSTCHRQIFSDLGPVFGVLRRHFPPFSHLNLTVVPRLGAGSYDGSRRFNQKPRLLYQLAALLYEHSCLW